LSELAEAGDPPYRGPLTGDVGEVLKQAERMRSPWSKPAFQLRWEIDHARAIRLGSEIIEQIESEFRLLIPILHRMSAPDSTEI
jgi:hypothetical protein